MTWTTVYDVENLLQVDIDESTHPSDEEVGIWITEVEQSMLKRGFGSQTTTANTVIDVPPVSTIGKGSIAWLAQGLPPDTQGKVVVPPFTPIISVNSGTMSRNTASLNSTPSWEVLKSKDNLPDADDTDFLILKEYNRKVDREVGVAFYFYGSQPNSGKHKLRATWVYGWNVDSTILGEYATLQASRRVLMAKMLSGEPVGVAQRRGRDFQSYVNSNYDAQLIYVDARIDEIEQQHFPKRIPVAVMQGV
jgi:hypothetical protein